MVQDASCSYGNRKLMHPRGELCVFQGRGKRYMSVCGVSAPRDLSRRSGQAMVFRQMTLLFGWRHPDNINLDSR